jgi:hypothetical protein
MIYSTADTKATPASDEGVGVDFDFDIDFSSPRTLWNVFIRELRDSVVFGSTVCPFNDRRILRIPSLVLITFKLSV